MAHRTLLFRKITTYRDLGKAERTSRIVSCYNVPAMKAIRYGLHFATLTVAALVFWLATMDLTHPVRSSYFGNFYYGLMGALHAISIVLSLRDSKPARPIYPLCFISLAAIWSHLTPFIALLSSVMWDPIRQISHRPTLDLSFLVYLNGSIIGSSGYWLLVRLFWLKSLKRAAWLRTMALCAAATLFSLVAVEKLNLSDHINFILITAVWWYAFSLSLYWSETSALARKTTQATVTAS